MRALILTASGVEDCELFYPYYRFKEEAVEVDVASPDGNLITSRCPPDLPAFCREIFAAVRQAV